MEIMNPLADITDPKDYLLLEGRKHGSYEYSDILVGKSRTHFHKSWIEQHELLHKEQAKMLTPRQFVDFVGVLKSGKAFDGRGNKVDSKELKSILDEIIMLREPMRAEPLDATFKIINNFWHINYEHRLVDGVLTPKYTMPLADCIMKDILPRAMEFKYSGSYMDKAIADYIMTKKPGKDLDFWLQNANSQGLPQNNNREGELYYMAPKPDGVVFFVADSGGLILDCHGDSLDANSGKSGVRPARLRTK